MPVTLFQAKVLAVAVARRKAAKARLDEVELDVAAAVDGCRSVGLSWPDIARIMNLSEKTVTNRYAKRARAAGSARAGPDEQPDPQAVLPFL